jgi:hypothetical protein
MFVPLSGKLSALDTAVVPRQFKFATAQAVQQAVSSLPEAAVDEGAASISMS